MAQKMGYRGYLAATSPILEIMQNMISEIQLFAGTYAPRAHTLCLGQHVSISTNTTLFSLIGTTYGGDGRTYFDLPNIAGTADHIYYNIITEGGGVRGMNMGPQCMGTNTIGEICYWGATFAPHHFMYCDGQELEISQYPALFAAIGTTYGGGNNTFKLPKLADIPPKAGSTGSTKAMIRVQFNSAFHMNGIGCTLASIMQFAGERMINTKDWMACDGTVLKTADNAALFSLLGNRFGGDGVNTFALPKLETGNDTSYYICTVGVYPQRM